MRGSIRLGVGFLIVFGAVGTLEADPSASLLTALALATVGLVVMYFGVTAMEKA